MEAKTAQIDGRLVLWSSQGTRHCGVVRANDVGILAWSLPKAVAVTSQTGSKKEFGFVESKERGDNAATHRYVAWDGMELEIWSE